MKQSYAFKVDHSPEITLGLQRFLNLEIEAAQKLLDGLWSEEWVRKLGTSGGSAYKAIGENTVSLTLGGREIYLPSRFRRGVAEEVGRTLRSQYVRMTCFEDVQKTVALTGLEGDLNDLVRVVALTIQFTEHRYYKWQLVRQTLRMLRKWQFRYGIDATMLRYFDIVRPHIQHAVFPFGVDDGGTEGQLFKYRRKHKEIIFEIKLPITTTPGKKNDWVWLRERIIISHKVRKLVHHATKRNPSLPDARLFALKGSTVLPVLQFSWEFDEPVIDIGYYQKSRVLAVDSGMVNLTTSVVCQAGFQITPPHFDKPDPKQMVHIERLYELIEKLQRKLDSFPVNYRAQGRRRQERDRLYAKLARLVKDRMYLTSKRLLNWAQLHGCSTVVFENLASYEAPTGRHALSRRLNNWFRGALVQTVKHKALLVGIKVEEVPPDWTSSYCPRCGKRGIKILDPRSRVENPYGRYFHCSQCKFTADRDYIGALNIYRVFLLPKKYRKHIEKAKPLVYRRQACYLSVIGISPSSDGGTSVGRPTDIQ